ncbi:MAG: endonuclease V [Marmoricola sp.]
MGIDPAEALLARQRMLAGRHPEPWRPATEGPLLGGCWVCFPRGLTGPGDVGDPAWVAAVVMRSGSVVSSRVHTGVADAPYVAGLLALRIGRLLQQAVASLAVRPDVLLLDATGRDHPRRAGLAIDLGEAVGLPTVGVTHRPLVAGGAWPGDGRGDAGPLRIGDEVVGAWLRTRAGARPLVVHPGWRTDTDTAVDVVLRCTRRRRTPEPLRRSRQLARQARSDDTSPS